jgi:hypothetical protein
MSSDSLRLVVVCMTADLIAKPASTRGIWREARDDFHRLLALHGDVRCSAATVRGSSSSPTAVHKWLKDAKKAGII